MGSSSPRSHLQEYLNLQSADSIQHHSGLALASECSLKYSGRNQTSDPLPETALEKMPECTESSLAKFVSSLGLRSRSVGQVQGLLRIELLPTVAGKLIRVLCDRDVSKLIFKLLRIPYGPLPHCSSAAKDEFYRTDLPSHSANFYSSSSVYSYSPTTTSDCPEHGRSKKKITIILTVSIVLATLGVLSIAGVAAYLGVLSKNASTSNATASLGSEEPSYLLSGSKDGKNPLIITRGRINDDIDIFNEHNSRADLTNSLEVKPALESNDHHLDIQRPEDHTRRTTTSKVVFSQRNSTSAVKSSSTSSSTGPKNPRERYPHSGATDVTGPGTKSTQATTSSSNSVYDTPIIIRAPPSQSTTMNPFVRNRHRNRYPPTNSHSLSPPLLPGEVTVSTDGQVNVQPETKEPSTGTISSTSSTTPAVEEPNDNYQDQAIYYGHGNGHTGHSEEDYVDRIILNQNQQAPPAPANKDFFVPVVPTHTSRPTVGSWLANVTRNAGLNKTLTFDRVAPQFYDKSPWTPLLNRPNLDKRPRVDVNRVSTEATSSTTTTTLKTTTLATADISQGFVPETFYPEDYMHSDHADTSMQRDDAYYPGTGQEGSGTGGSSGSFEEPYYTSQSEEEMLKPPDIPAYTVYIPHISSSPADLPGSSGSSMQGSKPGAKIPFGGYEQGEGGKLSNTSINTNRDVVSPNPATYELAHNHEHDAAVDDHKLHETMKEDKRVVVQDYPHDGPENEEKLLNNGTEASNQGISYQAGTSGGNRKNVKEEDYTDNEDEEDAAEHKENSSKIYKLDPNSVDIVPDTLATAQPPTIPTLLSSPSPLPPNREIRKEDELELMQKDMPSSEEEGDLPSGGNFEKVPLLLQDPDQTSVPEAINTESQVKEERPAGDTGEKQAETSSEQVFSGETVEGESGEVEKHGTKEQAHAGNGSSESPLFPPVRSYVGINQPLRPKPSGPSESDSESESESKRFLLLNSPEEGEPPKKVRIYKEDEEKLPDLSLTTTSSLNKVLSMMMNFDRDQSLPLSNITTQNVQLVVADNGKAIIVKNGTTTPGSNREPKVFKTRDPKIGTQFSGRPTAHVPVPLISTTVKTVTSSISNTTAQPSMLVNKTRVSTVTVTNSPVYKFVLRKGQSVEDLLKEIFQNFTEKSGHNMSATSLEGAAFLGGDVSKISTYTDKEDHAEDSTAQTDFTTGFTRHPLIPGFMLKGKVNATVLSTVAPKTTMDPMVKTSTSVVVNGDFEPCPSNTSFRCESTGKCISGFARCNGIRDCPDNSDEKGCLCVDHLRAQMLHRKICDGVPDCKDFSDEYQCDWCTPGQYICAGSRACVNREKICDGKRDCPRGDDENECVKIGQSGATREELEDLTPTYHRSGILMVRKKGVWGKLCVETFSTVVSHWEVKDLARAVCKALTFSDFEAVERIEDEDIRNGSEPYYELFYGASGDKDSSESSYSSSESTPRSGLGFKQTTCKSRLVVRVTCQDLQCGTAPRAFTQAARIVGGSNAHPGEWPWQAALYRNGEYQCGATLISGRWLLSAGHCFYHAQDDYWVARLGTLRRGATVLSPYEQVIRITHIFLHPQYKDVGFINDVSLLRLETEVNFTDFVRPVCLPGRDTKIRDGRMCTVVGWGQLFEVGRVFPDTLQEVQLPLISTAECRKRTLFLPLYKLTDEMFCAGFDRGGRDACLGDSGGPLMCPENDGRWSLYGVTSNGYGCARANRPGVYTKVARYLDWIYEKMSQDNELTYRDKGKPCNGHRCPLGECLEPKRVCNGFSDCLDGSDERNCTWS